MDYSKIINKNLLALLTKHQLSANQLAQRLGIPFMTIRRLLSGETTDPRISTLSMIADHFNVTIDELIEENNQQRLTANVTGSTLLIPILHWEDLPTWKKITDPNYSWGNMRTISFPDHRESSEHMFGLESRPSMYPRFPIGTLFIINPHTTPRDGDIILLELIKSREFTLKELSIDPPDRRLLPLSHHAPLTVYQEKLHTIIGVNILTIFYNAHSI